MNSNIFLLNAEPVHLDLGRLQIVEAGEVKRSSASRVEGGDTFFLCYLNRNGSLTLASLSPCLSFSFQANFADTHLQFTRCVLAPASLLPRRQTRTTTTPADYAQEPPRAWVIIMSGAFREPLSVE